MFSVVIADDDFVICEGIKRIIEDNCPDIKICGIFYDGDELYQYVTSHTVDIVITDFRMPGRSWTETSDYLQKSALGTHIILVTAYQEFEYAKTAIDHHVDFLICKPFKSSLLIDNLKSVCERIKSQAEIDIEISQKLLHNWELLRKSLKGIYQDSESPDYAVHIFEYLKPKPLTQYRIFEIYYHFETADADLDKLKQFAADCGEFDCPDYSVFFLNVSNNQFVFLAVCKDGLPDAATKDFIKSAYINLGLALSVRTVRFENINEWSDGRRYAVICEHLSEIIDDANLSSAYLKTVTSRYEQKNLFSLYENIIRYLNSSGMPIDRNPEITEKTDFKEVQKAINELPFRISVAESDSINIKRAVQYSKQHYQDSNFSLYTLADALGLSPSHLGKLFKKELSANFSSYLLKLRMEKAKELLRTTDDSIQEICQKVGYNYPAYFRKVFGNYAGMSPTQYRNTN